MFLLRFFGEFRFQHGITQTLCRRTVLTHHLIFMIMLRSEVFIPPELKWWCENEKFFIIWKFYGAQILPWFINGSRGSDENGWSLQCSWICHESIMVHSSLLNLRGKSMLIGTFCSPIVLRKGNLIENKQRCKRLPVFL